MHEPQREPWYLSVVEWACYGLGFVTFFFTVGCVLTVVAVVFSPTLTWDPPTTLVCAVCEINLWILTCLCMSVTMLWRQHHPRPVSDRDNEGNWLV